MAFFIEKKPFGETRWLAQFCTHANSVRSIAWLLLVHSLIIFDSGAVVARKSVFAALKYDAAWRGSVSLLAWDAPSLICQE